MSRKKQRIWCCIISCLILLAGMYTTYEKADSLAKHVMIKDSITRDEAEHVQKVLQTRTLSAREQVYLTSRTTSRFCEMLGRLVGRSSLARRDLRLSILLLWGIITAYFLLRYFWEEEVLCLHEKDEWTALIKYIHDIDGKKRVLCLT